MLWWRRLQCNWEQIDFLETCIQNCGQSIQCNARWGKSKWSVTRGNLLILILTQSPFLWEKTSIWLHNAAKRGEMIILKSSGASSLQMPFSLGICLSAFLHEAKQTEVSDPPSSWDQIYTFISKSGCSTEAWHQIASFLQGLATSLLMRQKSLPSLTSKYAFYFSLSLHPIFLTSSSNTTTQFTTGENKSAPNLHLSSNAGLPPSCRWRLRLVMAVYGHWPASTTCCSTACGGLYRQVHS